MPIIDKCEKCGRQRGYAPKVDDTICARCAKSNEAENNNNQAPE